MKKNLSKIFSIITIVLFCCTLIVLIVGTIAIRTGKPLTLFGYMYSVVPTSSMEPDIHVGDFVISKHQPYSELEPGMDVIYYSEENGIYILHRIKEKTDDGFIMYGINNNGLIDNEKVTEDNYIATKVWNGNILNLGKFTTQYRWVIFLILVLVFGVIFVSETLNIINTVKEKKAEEQRAKILKEIENEVREEIKKEQENEHNL